MLEPVLKQLGWCDEIAILLNNVTEKERGIVKRYATFIKEDNRIWGENQWRLKQDFLARVVEHCKPDWCWCLDMDEVFDPRFNRQTAEKMASGHDIAWYFWCLQLFNSPEQVRLDLSFPNIRFYKVIPEIGLHFLSQALHCGLAPKYAYQHGSQSGLYFKHYGLMQKEDRERKIARYDKYDPKAIYKGKSWYDALRNERARTVGIDEAIKQIPEFIYRRKAPSIMKHKNELVTWFRNKHGKPVPAFGEQQHAQMVRMGFQELISVNINSNPEAPVIDYGHETVEEVSERAPTPPSPAPKRRGTRKKGGSKESPPEFTELGQE